MTNRINILEPNLYNVALFVQENALKGYRVAEGYPILFGYQYEVIMDKVADEQPAQDTEDKPKRGRKAAEDK